MHVAEGFGDPHINNMAKLEQVLRGIKSVQCRNSKRINGLPISPNLMSKMRKVWVKEPCTFNGTMLWAASSLFFSVFFALGRLQFHLIQRMMRELI